MDLDLQPTQPLRGLHYRGTVVQRVIANYPVAPETLAPFVPSEARLWTRVTTKVYAFRDRLGVKTEADHAIAMAHCPHYFGRPVRV